MSDDEFATREDRRGRRTYKGLYFGIWLVALVPIGLFIWPTPAGVRNWLDRADRTAEELGLDRDPVARVEGLDWSPAAPVLAAHSPRPEVLVWDANEGGIEARLEGHAARVRAVRFAPGGALLATGDDDGVVILWNTATWTEQHRLQVDHAVASMDFHPTRGELAVGNTESRYTVFDLATRTRVCDHGIGDPQEVLLRYRPDGEIIAFNGRDGGRISFKEATTYGSGGGRLHGARRKAALAFPGDGTRLLTCDLDGEVALWQPMVVKTLPEETSHWSDPGARGCAAAPGVEAFVTYGSDAEVRVWSLDQPEPVHRWTLSRGDVLTAAISADGERLALGTADGAVLLLDMASGSELRTIEIAG